MSAIDLVNMPTAVTAQGIHICAALEIEAGHLRAHRIGWAAATMDVANAHIKALEEKIIEMGKKNLSESS